MEIFRSAEGKAAGPDDVYIEVIKLLNDENLDALVEIFNNIYETGEIPADWISLLSQVLKLFLKIIHTRIYNRCERDIGPTKFAFRQGFGTREAVFGQYYFKNAETSKKMFFCDS